MKHPLASSLPKGDGSSSTQPWVASKDLSSASHSSWAVQFSLQVEFILSPWVAVHFVEVAFYLPPLGQSLEGFFVNLTLSFSNVPLFLRWHSGQCKVFIWSLKLSCISFREGFSCLWKPAENLSSVFVCHVWALQSPFSIRFLYLCTLHRGLDHWLGIIN